LTAAAGAAAESPASADTGGGAAAHAGDVKDRVKGEKGDDDINTTSNAGDKEEEEDDDVVAGGAAAASGAAVKAPTPSASLRAMPAEERRASLAAALETVRVSFLFLWHGWASDDEHTGTSMGPRGLGH